MKKSNVVKTLMSVLFILAILTSCGVKTVSDLEKDPELSGKAKNATSTVDNKENVTGLTAKKLFEFKDYDVKSLLNNMLIYENDADDKYGIRTYSGKDSGLIYDYVDYDSYNGLITVSDSQYSKYKTSDSVDAVNVFGLYTSDGKNLAPCEFAYYHRLNDRYIEAYKAIKQVPDGTDDVIKKGDKYISKSADGPSFSYDKIIIDSKTGKSVDESQINYFNQSDKVSFPDASYVIRTTEVDTVYNSDGEVLFSYNPDDYMVESKKSDYYIARKTINGEYSYFALDKSGEKVTAEFDRTFDIYGNIISYKDKDYKEGLYTFDGKKFFNESFDYFNYDKLSKDLYILKKGESYIFINGSGKNLLKVTKNDETGTDVYSTNMLAYKEKKDSATAYYNFAEEKYSITAYRMYSVGHLLVSGSDGDGRYDLIDVTNGNVLCKGYKDYHCSNPENGCCYLSAKRTEGGYDIYRIQNKVDAVKNSFDEDVSADDFDLSKIYEMKEDLFETLEKALKKSGLSASIDRNSGEIAFDAAVIFSGDSAELSDGGKAVLDSFIKAYSSVLSDEKFKGFISKTMVEGHTAPLANSTYESGLPLSEERAGNVKDYCKGVDSNSADIFEAVGYSNSMPIYNLDGTVNLDASRRVTFKCIINADF